MEGIHLVDSIGLSKSLNGINRVVICYNMCEVRIIGLNSTKVVRDLFLQGEDTECSILL